MFTPSIIIYPHYGPKISSMLSRAIVGLYQRPLDGGSTADFGTHEPWPGNPNHGDQQSQRNVSETSSYNHICIFIYIPGKKKPSYGTDSFIDYLPINWFFIAILKYQIVYIYLYVQHICRYMWDATNNDWASQCQPTIFLGVEMSHKNGDWLGMVRTLGLPHKTVCLGILSLTISISTWDDRWSTWPLFFCCLISTMYLHHTVENHQHHAIKLNITQQWGWDVWQPHQCRLRNIDTCHLSLYIDWRDLHPNKW